MAIEGDHHALQAAGIGHVLEQPQDVAMAEMDAVVGTDGDGRARRRHGDIAEVARNTHGREATGPYPLLRSTQAATSRSVSVPSYTASRSPPSSSTAQGPSPPAPTATLSSARPWVTFRRSSGPTVTDSRSR